MPVSNTSRYFGIPVYDAVGKDGVPRPTIGLRSPSPPAPATSLYRHMVTGTETIEYLASRYYGSSAAWWRIAEANGLVFPTDVVPGMILNIPAAGDVGRIVRTRRF
jgi:nucleoid-associated protein YgaU